MNEKTSSATALQLIHAAEGVKAASMMTAKGAADKFAQAAVNHAAFLESALREVRQDNANLAAELARLRAVVADLCARNGLAGAML
ncbi:hypothetical protein [Chitinilyticum aquatile]|uniref:hypothetical protein n=1 Tax=Chitinilyticum aquatile TaxID=362520 RepID=UPI0004123AA4|nr:hypothetical protein [Chitinilyticum aquatile]